MKKFALFISVASVLFTNNLAFAGEYGAKCLHIASGKMRGCIVFVSTRQNSFEMNFRSDKYQKDNLRFRGDKIVEISSGEHAQKRTKETIGASLVLGPLGALVGLAKEKRTQFAIEYTDPKGKTNIALIDIKTKDGVSLGQDLESLTGVKIRTTENPQ
ncbi:hypothetical protein [Hydrocoleum sp. CS-953]|uniref:hypothetical protein n=1 Tax=Microcoleaceae TaxID=1892252 RepID=UPI000B9B2284|nr:hypothetical protein [Hydrocoleum sp. CS-953]OZH53224.1 hypothetical protein AFK68_19045 [Hydrocoleum sp. CS-953]